MSEAESHFHPCPGCSEAVECQLTIGDGDCGKLRCANCSPSSPPEMEPETGNRCHAEHNGWVCTLTKGHEWHEHIAQTSDKRVRDKWPVSKAAEEEAETCDNCGEDITPENPAMEWDGDSRCKDCYPHCSKCDCELADDGDWITCHDCDNLFCEAHSTHCQCCDIAVCDSCGGNHGT